MPLLLLILFCENEYATMIGHGQPVQSNAGVRNWPHGQLMGMGGRETRHHRYTNQIHGCRLSTTRIGQGQLTSVNRQTRKLPSSSIHKKNMASYHLSCKLDAVFCSEVSGRETRVCDFDPQQKREVRHVTTKVVLLLLYYVPLAIR